MIGLAISNSSQIAPAEFVHHFASGYQWVHSDVQQFGSSQGPVDWPRTVWQFSCSRGLSELLVKFHACGCNTLFFSMPQIDIWSTCASGSERARPQPIIIIALRRVLNGSSQRFALCNPRSVEHNVIYSTCSTNDAIGHNISLYNIISHNNLLYDVRFGGAPTPILYSMLYIYIYMLYYSIV